MQKIYIDKLSFYNRINYASDIKHNANLTFTIAKRSMCFAFLKKKINSENIFENCFKKKYKGILVSYDDDLECAIINNITYEDLYLDIFNEPIFLISSDEEIINTNENENSHNFKSKKQKSKVSEKN